MSLHKDDHILWFAVGIGLFFAVHGIFDRLYQVRDLTEVNSTDGPGKKLDQETEDAVSIETLSTLANSHNRELRNAAIRIVCDRFARGPAIERLYNDLSGRNAAKRDAALTTALFMLNSSALNESNVGRIFYGYEFLRALTLCLVNLLPEHERLKSKSARTPPWEGLVLSAKPTSSPIRPPNRPIAETQALQILHKILPTAPNTALLAGLVPEWLAKYPFPCALPENGSRRDLVLKYFTVWHTDDPLMAYVLGFIQTFPDGQHALKKAGLAASHDYLDDDTDDEYEEWDEYDHVIEFGDFDGDIPMHGGEDTAGTVSESGRRRVRRRRYHVDSAEEQAMRRRRREAMVFSEGGGPLGQDNIILRNEDVRSPVGREQGDGEGEVEEQLSRLQEEVDREFEEAPILNDQQMLEALR